MRSIFYLSLWIALNSLGIATANLLTYFNNDASIVGGASHECYRTCVAGETRTCYYEFAVSSYSTMGTQCGDCPNTTADCYTRGCITAGGNARLVTVANYMLPGPSIQVCEGDNIQVKVINGLGSEGVTIHWHGLSQIDTPFMDGVPFLTQCPILPGNTFLYNFTAFPGGTHMWHSHAGMQEDDGLYGALVIRAPDDENVDQYDFDLPEHIMTLWHWYSKPSAEIFGGASYRDIQATGYDFTVNGFSAKLPYAYGTTNLYTPRANFTVTQGYKYRFRMIANMGVYCPVQVSVDKHKMTAIASDGASLEPFEVDSIIINAGERYDFVLTADQDAQSYWIRFRGLGRCETGNTAISSLAVLYYEGADTDDPSESTTYDDAKRNGTLLNPVAECEEDYSNNTLLRWTDLKSNSGYEQDVSGTPNVTLYIQLSLNKYSEAQMTGPYAQFNSTSWSNPIVPFLTQYNDISEDMYCTDEDSSAKDCKNSYCTCPMIYEVPLGSLCEIIIADTTSETLANDDHPVHFHGHYLSVVAEGTGGTSITIDEVKELNENGQIERNLDNPPLKDSVGVPAHGYIVLRFVANNPGYWFLHCHVAAHLEEGMAITIKIGEHSDMAPTPADFPKCHGNYDITE